MGNVLHTLIIRSGIRAFAGGAVLLVCACSKVTPPFLPLVCEVGLEPVTDCAGVATIERAELFLETSGRFKLIARYAACHAAEDTEIAGSFQTFAHANGADIELLAKSSSGGSAMGEQPRTIGLINLDTQSLKGRFTDTAAVIRSRGQVNSAPMLDMQCRKKN